MWFFYIIELCRHEKKSSEGGGGGGGGVKGGMRITRGMCNFQTYLGEGCSAMMKVS